LAAASIPASSAVASGRSESSREQSGAGAGIEFDFTGLFAFKLSQTKEMRLLLLNAKKAKLKDEHAPLLIMPFKYYKPGSIVNPLERHEPPNIVRLGDDAMAVWSLAGLRFWMPDAHELFDGNDQAPTLKFDDAPVDTRKDPSPIDKDAGWASLYWFVKMPELLKDASALRAGSLECKEKTVASTIRLTRGAAAGRAPKTDCEQHRKYIIGDDIVNKRSFATQLHVVYTLAPHETTRLALAPSALSNQSGGAKFIGVQIENGLTPISILNSPLTHFSHDHYKAFYKMVGKSGKSVMHDDPCTDELKAAGAPSAPYPDCIPPYVP